MLLNAEGTDKSMRPPETDGLISFENVFPFLLGTKSESETILLLNSVEKDNNSVKIILTILIPAA